MAEQQTEPRRLEINWVQAAGGALAAVSSAVLLSTLGVAGTIIGAAAGSVIVTVGNSVYSHYLAASKERVAAAAVIAREQALRVRERKLGRGTETSLDNRIPPPDEMRADDQTEVDGRADDQASGAGTPVDQRPAWRTVLGGLPWKRLAGIAVGLFVVAMAAILAFELATGRAVSTYTGGSDRDGPRTSFGGSADPDRDRPEPTKTTESTPAKPTSTPPESTPTTTTTTVPPEGTEETEETEPEPTTTAPTTTAPATTPPAASAPTPTD